MTETQTILKASELRIGNILNQKYVELERTPTGVKGKGSYFMPNPIQAGDLNAVEGFPDNFQPIPLTPEILNKCNLGQPHPSNIGKAWRVHSYEWEPDNFSIWIELEDDKLITQISAEMGEYNANMKPLQYVHQLQNLYFELTGNELEINL